MVSKNEHALRSCCPIACTLDIIGDHWSLLIIRDLMFLGRHEYKDMLNAAEGISTNILCDRLKKLVANQLVMALVHPESKKRKLYYLTQKGKDLIHILVDILHWSEKHLQHQVDIPPEIRTLLLEHPERFKKNALAELKAWEASHGV